MCVHVHVDMSVRWDKAEKVSFQPQHLHISSLIFHLASKSIFEFLPRQWSFLWEESKNLKDRGGKSPLALLHSHQLWWINEKCGPRQEQHEMVMGSLCSQNATGAIHALWGKVAAGRWEKVNIGFLLKENQCTSIPLSQVKMSIFTLPAWKHSNFFVKEDKCLWCLLTLFSIWQPIKWMLSAQSGTLSILNQQYMFFLFMLHRYTNSGSVTTLCI